MEEQKEKPASIEGRLRTDAPIEKFGISFEQTDDNTVEISDADYKKVWNAYKNKKYIENLTNLGRGLCTHGYIY